MAIEAQRSDAAARRPYWADREAAASSNSAGEDDDDPDDYWSRFKFPSDDSAFDKFLWVSGLPFVFLFQITIPDCAKTKAEKYYIVTFIMSAKKLGHARSWCDEYAVHTAGQTHELRPGWRGQVQTAQRNRGADPFWCVGDFELAVSPRV